MRTLIANAGVLLVVGCSAVGPATRDDGPSPVVATYADRVIRQSEVDGTIGEELAKFEEQIFELRSEAAERLALEVLVAQAAKKEGLTEEAWLTRYVESAVPEVSEKDMRALFEKARGQIPAGVTFDDVKPQLEKAVRGEHRTKKAREVFGKLKKEAQFKMVLASPPRHRKDVEPVGPSKGGAQAKIVIVEFADFQCPYCARVNETVGAVMKAYGDKVRLVFRHYPLGNHTQAPKAAEAAACADEQGKFWEFHDALFESNELDVDALKMQAKGVGIDQGRFSDCLASGRMAQLVTRDMAAGRKAGVTGTPAFFINGIGLSGAQPEEAFRRIIDSELARLGIE